MKVDAHGSIYHLTVSFFSHPKELDIVFIMDLDYIILFLDE